MIKYDNCKSTTYKVDPSGTEEITYAQGVISSPPQIDVLYNTESEAITKESNYSITGEGKINTSPSFATIKKIKGKSLVWNQLNNYASSMWKQYDYVTTIAFNSNTHIISYKPNTLSSSKSADLNCIKTNNGNKFFVKFSVEFNPSVIYRIKYSENGVAIRNFDISSGKVNCSSVITQNNIRLFTILATMNNEAVSTDVVIVRNAIIVDLTLMFGAGNEPATPEEFEKMFPLDYYDYNEGTIIPFAGQNLVTTGFNQWDEQWEQGTIDPDGAKGSNNNYWRCKNLIPVISGEVYYIKANRVTQIWVANYNVNGTFVFRQQLTYADYVTYTIPSGVCFVIVFMGGTGEYQAPNNDICINISDEDRNGTYEPYEKHTLPLPSQWRDKQGNLVFPYGGMHGVGTAYDYAEVDADGYIRKVVRCFGRVDLGSLTWTISGKYIIAARLSPEATNTYNNICSKYKTVSLTALSMFMNKTLGVGGSTIYVRDDDFSDANTFKASMNGVMLYYELATPVEVELASPILIKRYIGDKEVKRVYIGDNLVFS